MANHTVRLSIAGLPGIEAEALAWEDITPGMLLNLDSVGGINYVRLHNYADGSVQPPLVAVEDLLFGKTIDDDYVTAPARDMVKYIVGRPGDTMWMWIAANVQCDIGVDLFSAGDGTLQRQLLPPTYEAGALVGRALENPGFPHPVQRIKIELA